MRVIEVTAFGGPEALHVVERPDPVAAPGQVLVRVRAANVNPTDLSVRDGSVVRRAPSVTPPVVPGWDLAGEIAAVGDGVTGLEPGTRVVGMIHWPSTRAGSPSSPRTSTTPPPPRCRSTRSPRARAST